MLETSKNPALLKLDLALRGVDAPWASDAKWLELQLDGEIWARARSIPNLRCDCCTARMAT